MREWGYEGILTNNNWLGLSFDENGRVVGVGRSEDTLSATGRCQSDLEVTRGVVVDEHGDGDGLDGEIVANGHRSCDCVARIIGDSLIGLSLAGDYNLFRE